MKCNECNIVSVQILDAGTKAKYYELTKYYRNDKVSKHLIEVIRRTFHVAINETFRA